MTTFSQNYLVHFILHFHGTLLCCVYMAGLLGVVGIALSKRNYTNIHSSIPWEWDRMCWGAPALSAGFRTCLCSVKSHLQTPLTGRTSQRVWRPWQPPQRGELSSDSFLFHSLRWLLLALYFTDQWLFWPQRMGGSLWSRMFTLIIFHSSIIVYMIDSDYFCEHSASVQVYQFV